MSSQGKTPFSFYWRVAIRPHVRLTIMIILLTLGSAFFDLFTVGITVPLMDALIDPAKAHQGQMVGFITRHLAHGGVPPQENNLLIFTLLAVACVLFVARSLFLVLQRYSAAAFAMKLRREMKATLFQRFLCAPYETLTRWARGTVVQRINDPADAIHTTIGNLAQFLLGAVNCVVMISFMVYLSWWATVLIGFIVLVTLQGWHLLSGHRSARHGRILFDLRGEQNKIEVDAIDGIKVIKAHALEATMVGLEKKLLRAEWKPTSRLRLFQEIPQFINEFSASVIVLGLGALTFFFPSVGIRFSMLVAFLFAIRRVAPSISLMNSARSALSSLTRTLEVIDDVLNHMPQERRGGQIPSSVQEIQLKDVSFFYAARSEHLVLNQITATLAKGTVTAIVGATGAGKSTLAQLLIGFFTPHSGHILVNGVELDHLDLSLWRSTIGYVAQDVFVFNTTIRENIALWHEVPESEIEWAARTAQLHDFILSLPQGYYTVVGDRGLRLSGGQCQRLAIARAILRRPEVLIFDEATSALDSLTERAVYNAIQTMHQEAIVIVIAHRLTTVKEADQILVLHSGHIVEEGNHKQLLEQEGVYASLYGENVSELAEVKGNTGS